ncbi:MAG: hypothetical protein LAN37_11770 [Acidobacteriia bacterium]|nr:hypothetical protein [Terriglobia bacterium]
MGSDEYPAPQIAATSLTQPTQIAVATAHLPAPAKTSPAGLWVLVGVAVVIALVGGYFVVGRRAPQGSSNAGGAPAPMEAARPAPQPSTPKVETPAVAPSEAQPDTHKAPHDRRVRELVATGRRHLDSGEYDLAIRDLREALGLEPGDAAAQAQLKRAEQAKRTEDQVLGRKH